MSLALRYLSNRGRSSVTSRGYIPYLQTYPGRETPNPFRIDLTRGSADLRAVMEDVLNLTKLNFNACIYGDGASGDVEVRRRCRGNPYCGARTNRCCRSDTISIRHKFLL